MVISSDSVFARRAVEGTSLLRAGRLNEGFPLFDGWRDDPANTNKAPSLPFPRWRGQELEGKRLLIWSEHGFGDQIMYARFAALMSTRGADIAWLCGPELQRIFGALGVTILPANESHDLRCDFYCPSSALPLGFDLTPETIPNTPYLSASPRPMSRRVGLMPSASTPEKSLPDEVAADLARGLGALDLRPAATGAADFLDTAEIVAGLYLVVTGDTAAAHLAGAMGTPVWLMLPEPADWRWMSGRRDSPWYPTATLFRGAWRRQAEDVLRGFEAMFRA